MVRGREDGGNRVGCEDRMALKKEKFGGVEKKDLSDAEKDGFERCRRKKNIILFSFVTKKFICRRKELKAKKDADLRLPVLQASWRSSRLPWRFAD